MAKNKHRILSTAILESKLVNRLEKHGISCEIEPFTRITYRSDKELERKIEDLLQENITAIFTSKNAIEAIRKIPRITKAAWKIYCTGSSTAKLAEDTFKSASITGTAENASSLANLIIENNPGSTVNFFCGDIRREDLPVILRSRNIEVREWLVYETKATPVNLVKEYQAIVFLSPSAVKSYFSMNKPSYSTFFFAIGNTTASEIKQFSENRIVTAKHASMDSLINAVLEEFQSVRTGDA
jgi:uroporphyrinogen-III synthase